LPGQGNGRQGQRPAALAQVDVGGAGFTDGYESHQAEDLGSHQGQDRGGVVAAGTGHGRCRGTRAAASNGWAGAIYGLLPGPELAGANDA
jgi:hypothetical protein